VNHLHRITAAPLADYVEFLWLSEGYAPGHPAERLLPTGRMGLVLDVGGHDPIPGLLSGARTSSFVLDTSRPLSLIGVAFKAGGGYPFVGVPAGELQDLTVPLQDVWDFGAQELRDKVIAAPSVSLPFRVLERFLLRRLAAASPRSGLVEFALREFQDPGRIVSVGDVVERSGVSARRFIEQFRNQVGLAPKAFCRMARFRQVIDHLVSATEVDWSDTALACGYYDQAHFIHEFREFAGVSPATYLRCRTASPNHLRVAQ
jgi:AraC-like DNA-binding protein